MRLRNRGWVRHGIGPETRPEMGPNMGPGMGPNNVQADCTKSSQDNFTIRTEKVWLDRKKRDAFSVVLYDAD